MKQIRIGVWETNSSSSHSLSVGKAHDIILQTILDEYESSESSSEWAEEQEEFEKTHILKLGDTVDFPDDGESERDYLVTVARSLVSKLNVLWGLFISDINTYDKPLAEMMKEHRVKLFITLCEKYLKDIPDLQINIKPTVGNPFFWKDAWTTKYYYSNISDGVLDNKTDEECEEYFRNALDQESIVLMDCPYGGLNQWTHIIIKII